MGQFRHSPGRRQPIGHLHDPLIDELTTMATGDKVHVRARMTGTRGKRSREAFSELIDALNMRSDDVLRVRPSARGQSKTLAGAVRSSREAVLSTVTQLAELGEQFGPNRNRELRRGGRRRSPQVGHMVDQGRIGLMPDGRDERDR